MRVLSVGWDITGPGIVQAEFFSAESLSSYDAVLIDPEPLPNLWRGHALLEPDGQWRIYPGRDHGLSRALENLFLTRRQELEDLLARGGGVVVVRVRAPGEGVEIAGNPPRRMGRYDFLPRVSLTAQPHHLNLPQGLRFLPRRGRDVVSFDRTSPFYAYLARFADLGYEAFLASTWGAPLNAFGRVLAQNKVGDVLGLQLPVVQGQLVFLPSFSGANPAEAGSLLVPALAALLAAPVGEGAPDWLTHYPLPGENELQQAWEELRAQKERLEREEEELGRALSGYDALRGLLFPRGVQGLMQAAKAALEKLGFSCKEAGPAFLRAEAEEGEMLLRAALAPFEPVGPEEHRALLLEVDRLRTEQRRDVKGVLLGVTEPRLDPRRRGWTWTEAVRRGAREHRFALVTGTELFFAVAAVMEGADSAQVRSSLLQAEGEWTWKG